MPWVTSFKDCLMLMILLGCQDSNLGMSEPKSDALPLGDTPLRLSL